MRGRILVGMMLVCLAIESIPTSGTEPQGFPQIKALFDHYHYTTADNWAQSFEDNYPGELIASYLTGPLTYEGLKEYDIFITYLSWKRDLGPRPTHSEVEALEEYVRNGGGVLLMGDDPYWGLWTNEYCNILSEPYGIFFNDDQLLDPTNYDISFVSPEDDIERYIVFHNMAEHPVMTGVSNVWAMGTCSLVVNNSEAVALVRGDDDTYSDRYAGYSRGSYPPAVVALEHGSGRIVFSGGAVTCGTNVYDNYTFVWNIIGWLAEIGPDLTMSPDLAISPNSIRFSKSSLRVGEEVMIEATIQNIGNADAGEFKVSFFDDNTSPDLHIYTQTIYSLRAGEAQTITVKWNWTVNPGNRNIRVEVDYSNSIAEKNERNNTSSKKIEILCDYDNLNYIHFPRSMKALIIVPYHHQGLVGYSDKLRSELESIGIQVDYYQDKDLEIEKLDELLDEGYAVIHITSHASTAGIAIEYFDNEKESERRWNELKNHYKEYEDHFEDMFTYVNDERDKKPYIGITGNFIKVRCTGLPEHPLVFLEGCYTNAAPFIRDGFLCKGAGAYLGFDGKPKGNFGAFLSLFRTADEVAEDFYRELIHDGHTVQVAVDSTPPADQGRCPFPLLCKKVYLVSNGNPENLKLTASSMETVPTVSENSMMRSLASTHLSQVEPFREKTYSLLQQAIGKGIDVSEAQVLIEDADEALADAKESYLLGKYSAANTLALRACNLYQQAIVILEKLLSS